MFEGFRDFFKAPYKDQMDAYEWAMFIGFLLCLVAMWKLVLGHILAELD